MVVVSSAVRCCGTVAAENRTIGRECEGTGGVGWAFSLRPCSVLLCDVFSLTILVGVLGGWCVSYFQGNRKGDAFWSVALVGRRQPTSNQPARCG